MHSPLGRENKYEVLRCVLCFLSSHPMQAASLGAILMSHSSIRKGKGALLAEFVNAVRRDYEKMKKELKNDY